MQDKHTQHFLVISLLVLFAAATRFLMIPNFTAVGAMGLFGAAYFKRKYLAFVIPFVALFLSDLILNNVVYAQYYDGFVLFGTGAYWTYIGFGAIVLIGLGLLRKINILNVIGASISASLAFFLITNFGVWASGILYPTTGAGLLLSYEAGLPFFQYSLMGDLFFSGVMFGLYEWAIRPLFQTNKQHASSTLDGGF